MDWGRFLFQNGKVVRARRRGCLFNRKNGRVKAIYVSIALPRIQWFWIDSLRYGNCYLIKIRDEDTHLWEGEWSNFSTINM